MPFVGTILIVLGILVALLGLYVTSPACQQFIKDMRGGSMLTKMTTIIAFANIVLICITLVSLYYAHQANTRAGRLFIGQNCPLIDVTPVGILQDAAGTSAMTAFKILNYSGFTAYNIAIDLKYGPNDWIVEWIKAENEKRSKGAAKGVVRGNLYLSSPQVIISKLKPGEIKERDDKGQTIGISGSLNLENDVCAKRHDEEYQVLVRATWKNVNGHVFDAVYKYRLICTVSAEGRSFTFIPLGIASQKEVEVKQRIG